MKLLTDHQLSSSPSFSSSFFIFKVRLVRFIPLCLPQLHISLALDVLFSIHQLSSNSPTLCVNLVKSPLPSPYLHRYVLYVIWTKADIKPAETWFYRVWLIELSLCAKCLLQSCYCLYVLQMFTFADFNYSIWRIKYDFTVISVIPMRRLSAVH